MISYDGNGWARAGVLMLGGALLVSACSTDANNSPGDDGSDSDTESSSSGGSSSSKSSSSSEGSGGSAGEATSSGSGGNGDCDTGDEGCECFPNDTCNGSLSCLSGLCVDAGSSGGNGGDGSGGGTSQGSGGDGSGGDGTGGGTTQGTGGDGSGGTGGTSQGSGGSGGDGTGGGATSLGSGGTGGSPEVSDETIIDNFSSCDESISVVAGRDGYWYDFGDDDINFQGDVGEPASGYSSQECAAWTNGGCTDTACNFGGNGFTFRSNESGYDVSDYSGIVFSIETDQDLWVVVHSTNGGAYGATISATGSQFANRSISFNSLSEADDSIAALDLTSVRSIEFTATEPDPGYGWAIWDVRFVD